MALMTSSPETAVQRHDRMMREERDQAERLRTDRGSPPDIWKGNAGRFSVPENEPPVVNILADLVGADSRVIDVGAGGGRITIPLAMRVREMIAVEPSAAMRDVLQREMDRLGVQNLQVIPGTWEDAKVDRADLVYAAHVTYGIPAIEPFLRKLDAASIRLVALVAFTEPAQHWVAPFWEEVYGEKRLRLPCRDELLDVLRELGAAPHVIPVDKLDTPLLGTADEAMDTLRQRLYIGQGNPHEQRLRESLERLTVMQEGGLRVKGALRNEQSVIWWEPGHMG